jgi:hypothetical protein
MPPRAVQRREMPKTPDGERIGKLWEEAPPMDSATDSDARAASMHCPLCGGNGWVRISRPKRRDTVAKLRGQPALYAIHCLCPLGEWTRARTTVESLGRMPDLALILAGKTGWRLER